MKLVTVDSKRASSNWEAEYNARKAAALKVMEDRGKVNAKIGSMSAFHTGLYGKFRQEPAW